MRQRDDVSRPLALPGDVAQIAEAARVAANTDYTSVGGKPQLLAAIMEGGTGDPAVARRELGRRWWSAAVPHP